MNVRRPGLLHQVTTLLQIPSRLTPLVVGNSIAVAAFFCILVLLVSQVSVRDPGSVFFKPDVGYERIYSKVRQEQAEQYVLAAKDLGDVHKSTGTKATLCVGVPSIARDGASYLASTIGSLTAGLTREERDDIHLIVFIAHTDPKVHPAYHEPWLTALADKVLTYDMSAKALDHLRKLEQQQSLFREKGLFDYSYLLEACKETGSPYVVMLEDDVLAQDGWYHRTIKGLEEAELKSVQIGKQHDWLYLRLFYTEEFLGFNSEDWPTHAFWSLLTLGSAGAILWSSRYFSATARATITPFVVILVCVGPVLWTIMLVFAAGKVTSFPISDGVNAMNKFGCCSQGLVFPHAKTESILEWFESKRVGFVDMLLEQYADEHDQQRWALMPSVLQHIGGKSSKGDDLGKAAKYDRPVAAKIWNFAFEMQDAEGLRLQHKYAAMLAKYKKTGVLEDT